MTLVSIRQWIERSLGRVLAMMRAWMGGPRFATWLQGVIDQGTASAPPPPLNGTSSKLPDASSGWRRGWDSHGMADAVRALHERAADYPPERRFAACVQVNSFAWGWVAGRPWIVRRRLER